MREDVRQKRVHRVGAPRHRARELAGGVLRRGGGLGLYDVYHGLGLRQVHAPVQEGALCEFAGPGLPRAEIKEPPERRREHDGRAVALQLRRVLAGVGARGAAHGAEAVVQRAPVRGQERAVDELPVAVRAHRPAVRGAEDGVRELEGLRPRDADYAYRADRAARGKRGNGVVYHVRPRLYNRSYPAV